MLPSVFFFCHEKWEYRQNQANETNRTIPVFTKWYFNHPLNMIYAGAWGKAQQLRVLTVLSWRSGFSSYHTYQSCQISVNICHMAPKDITLSSGLCKHIPTLFFLLTHIHKILKCFLKIFMDWHISYINSSINPHKVQWRKHLPYLIQKDITH